MPSEQHRLGSVFARAFAEDHESGVAGLVLVEIVGAGTIESIGGLPAVPTVVLTSVKKTENERWIGETPDLVVDAIRDILRAIEQGSSNVN